MKPLSFSFSLFIFGLALLVSSCGGQNPATPDPSLSNTPNYNGMVSSSAPSLTGVNLAGPEFNSKTLPGVHYKNFVFPSDAEMGYFAGKGARLIRLPFLWERLQPALNADLDNAYLNLIKNTVALAKIRGIQVILDVHNYGYYRGNMIGSSAVPYSAFEDLWTRIAAAFKEETAVYAYGLMNEPHGMGVNWPSAAQAGMNGVRAVDSNHMVFIAGDGWSAAHTWRTLNENLNVSDPSNNHRYEAHFYVDKNNSGTYSGTYDQEGAYPNRGVDRLTPFAQWLQAKGKKGFIGEYGIPANDPRWLVVMDNALKYMQQNDLGSTYWAGGLWWGTYPLSIEPANGVDKPQMGTLASYFTSAVTP